MEDEIKELEQKILLEQEATGLKIDQLNQLAQLQFEKSPVTSLLTAEKTILLARQIGYKKGEAQALLLAGMSASAQRNYEEAKQYYEQAKSIREELNDVEGLAMVHAKLGNTKLYSGNYNEALEHYATAIAIREELNDTLGAADLYTNSGIIYGFQGNHSQALKSHLRALNIYEAAKNENRIASSSNNIGVIYLNQKNYDEARKMFEQALEIRKGKNDQKAMSDLLDNIGLVHYGENKLQEALEYYQQAQRIRENLGDKAQLASSYSKIGQVYKSLGQRNIAVGYYETALELFKASKEKRGIVQSYVDLGEILIEKQDLEKAKEFLETAVKDALETGLKNQLRNALQLLSTVNALQKNFEKAYECYVEYNAVDKEISNADISKQIAQMTMRHEIEQKERETELEKAKNSELQKAYSSLEEEKKRSESLLHNILPVEVADEIKRNGKAEARYYESATILFCDIVGFTKISEAITPQQLIDCIDACYSQFDEIIEKHGIEKIKIIGDSYMCAGGIPVANQTHALDMLHAAFEMLDFSFQFSASQKRKGLPEFHFRFGINSGPVITGIVGAKKFAYDVWGDTVNVAARMEQSGEVDQINISVSTYQLVKEKVRCKERGMIHAKNKGSIDMYFAESIN